MSPEIVYFNGGEIYKQSNPGEGPRFIVNGVESTYRPATSDEVDTGEITRYVGEKLHPDGEVRVKRYRATQQLREIMRIGGGAPVDANLMCPSVSLWLAVATYDNDPGFCELYFRVQTAADLEAAAVFYGLPNPASPGLAYEMQSDPWGWAIKVVGLGDGKEPIVAASVAFRDGFPYLFKLYKSWAASRHPANPGLQNE